MTSNPEFVRNLWLVHRPIWMAIIPFLLGGAFLGLHAMETYGRPQSIFGRPQWEVYAFGLFFLVTMIHGSGKAAAAVTIEVQQHTWDGQRMSAISPWPMAWGKLFGSTAYAWYSGVICLLLYALMAQSQDLSAAHILKNVVVWILAGIVAQSVILMSALLNLIDAPLNTRGNSVSAGSLFCIIPAYIALPALWILLPADLGVTWYGWWFGALDLLLLTAVVFAAWAMTGAYFAMRREFQYTNSPLAWVSFVVFAIVYVAGFERGHGDPLPLLGNGSWKLDGLLPLYVGVMLTYASILSEPMDWQFARRLGRAIEGRAWMEVIDQTPRAVFTLAVLAVVVCGLAIAGNDAHWPTILGRAKADSHVLFAALMFVARDVGFVILVSISMARSPAGNAAMGGLLAMQVVLPVSALLLAEPLIPLFWPVPTEHPVSTLAPALIQMMAVWVFVGHRFRRIHAEIL